MGDIMKKKMLRVFSAVVLTVSIGATAVATSAPAHAQKPYRCFLSLNC